MSFKNLNKILFFLFFLLLNVFLLFLSTFNINNKKLLTTIGIVINDDTNKFEVEKIQGKGSVNVPDLTTDEDVGYFSPIQNLGNNKYLVGTSNKGFFLLEFNNKNNKFKVNKIKDSTDSDVLELTSGEVGKFSSIQSLGNNKYLVGTFDQGFWLLEFDNKNNQFTAEKIQGSLSTKIPDLISGKVGIGSSIQDLGNNKYLVGTGTKGFWLLKFDNSANKFSITNKIKGAHNVDVLVLTTDGGVGLGSSIQSLKNNKYLVGTGTKGFWLLKFDDSTNKFSIANKIKGVQGVNVPDLTTGFVGFGSSIQKLGDTNKYFVGTKDKGFWLLKFDDNKNKFTIAEKIKGLTGKNVPDLTSGEVGQYSSIQKLEDTNKYLVGTGTKGFWFLEFDDKINQFTAAKIKNSSGEIISELTKDGKNFVGAGSSIQSLGKNKYLVGTGTKGFWFLKFDDKGIKIKKLKQNLKIAKQSIIIKQTEINELTQELKTSNLDKDNKQIEIDVKQTEINELIQDLKIANLDKENKQTKINNLEIKNNKLTTDSKVDKQSIKTKQKEIDKLKQESKTEKSDKVIKQKEINKLTTDLETSNSEKNIKQAEIKKLTQDLKTANLDKENKQTEIDAKQTEINNLEIKNNKLTTDSKVDKQSIKTKQKEIDKLKQESKTEKSDKVIKQKEINKLTTDLETSNSEKNIKQAEIKKLTQDLKTANLDKENKQTEIDAKQTEINNLEIKNNKLTTDSKVDKQSIKTKQKEIDKLKQESKTEKSDKVIKQKEINKLTTDLETSNSEKNIKQAEIKKLTQDLKTANLDKENKQTEIDAKQTEINNLEIKNNKLTTDSKVDKQSIKIKQIEINNKKIKFNKLTQDLKTANQSIKTQQSKIDNQPKISPTNKQNKLLHLLWLLLLIPIISLGYFFENSRKKKNQIKYKRN